MFPKKSWITVLVLTLSLGATAGVAKAPEWKVVENPEGTLFEAMGLVGINPPRVMELLAEDAPVNILDRRGFTPLHYAVMYQDENAIHELSKRGARLHDVHVAAGIGDMGQMLDFLRSEAGLDDRDHFKATPLHWAAMGGHGELAEALIQRGAKVDLKNDQGRTPLMVAAFKGHDAVVKVLLKAGAAIKAADNGGNTPLHMACMDAYLSTAKLLLEKGADPKVKNKREQLPKDLAERKGHRELVDLLQGGTGTIKKKESTKKKETPKQPKPDTPEADAGE